MQEDTYRVLVVDFSADRKSIAGIFSRHGMQADICTSAYDAMTRLRTHDYDLVLSEVELPGDNAFDLYNYLSNHYPYIPVIMMTCRDMDSLFDHIFREGIGNILRKPLDEVECISLATRLITRRNIFGLSGYMELPDNEYKKIRITSSDQIQKAVNITVTQISEWGLPTGNKVVLNLILNELIINAVYHSYGYTREKEMRVPVTLKDNEFVDLCFAHNDSIYGISITDYRGKLSKMKILDSIHNAIEQNRLILRAAETGEDITELVSETGRGIDLVRKLSAEYYFVIKKDVRTEIILLFSREPRAENTSSSLKIIEDFPQTG